MKDKIFSVLQRVGRSFMLPVASKCGSVIFDNLPLIFAIGVAIGMAKKEKEVAALASAIAFFVMHSAISGMITIWWTGSLFEWCYGYGFGHGIVTDGCIRWNYRRSRCSCITQPIL